MRHTYHGWIATSTAQPRYSMRYLAGTTRYVICFSALAMMTLAFGSWYWWRGIDLYLPGACGGTCVWAVVRVDLYDWVRETSLVLNVMYVVVSGILTLRDIFLDLFYGTFHRETLSMFEGRSRPALASEYWITRLAKALLKFAQGDVEGARGSQGKNLPSLEQTKDQIWAFESTRTAELFVEGVFRPFRDPESHDLGSMTGNSVETDGISTSVRKTIRLPKRRQWKRLKDYLKWKFSISPTWQSFCEDVAIFLEFNEETPMVGTLIFYTVQRHARQLHIDNLSLWHSTAKALSVHRSKQPEDFPMWIDIACRAMLSRMPLKANRRWRLYASLDMLILIGLVVQVELTIRWNQIGGVNEMRSFGQLLAFFIGISGLIRVLFRKVSDVLAGIGEEDKEPERTAFDDAVDAYILWKGRTPQRRLTR